MTVNASYQNYLKAVQYVEACLSVSPLLCMVASDLTDRNQRVLCHSPFPHFILCLQQVNNSCERIFYRENSVNFQKKATAHTTIKHVSDSAAPVFFWVSAVASGRGHLSKFVFQT